VRPGATVSRRRFIRTTAAAGAGLVLAFHLPSRRAQAATPREPGPGAGPPFAPNAWIAIGTDGIVTLTLDRSEMGQGPTTALAMILADELEADWTRVRLGPAPVNPHGWSRHMTTGGSSSVRRSWDRLRKAGAAAREMLIAAAAKTWEVEPYGCRAVNGAVTHRSSGRSLGFGELAAIAGTLPVPADPPLKEAKDFHLIGHRVARLDTPQKVDGSARFGLDVRVPGMKVATIERAPVFGAKLKAVRDASTRRMPGVRQVVTLEPSLLQPTKDSWPTSTPAGVAVIADQYWQAVQGRRALEVDWDRGPNAALDSAAVRATFERLAAQPGVVVRHEGAGENALAGAHRRIEAVYDVPFQHHATMEPLNCVASVRPGACDIWAPTQNQTAAQDVAATILGLPMDAVRVHTTFLGGGFGRRLEVDYVAEAVRLSKAAGVPILVVWSREDDVRHGFYRPASLHRLAAAIDAQGRPTAWTHHIVGLSIDSRFGPLEKGVDDSLIDGAANLPYAIPNIQVEQSIADLPVPVGYWRSVGSSHNAFVTECFFDEIAASAGQDPLELRRMLLRDHPRHRLVLETAAAQAGWGSPLAPGRGRGIAVAESFGSFVAQVAEVSLDRDGVPRVHRVVCAVDCGQTVNPDTVEAQMQGGIVFGLTAALKSEITIEAGGVRQSNFHDYPILRMDEMPVIEVHVAAGAGSPGGIGEPGVPPIAPAVVNAIYAATGKRIRKLPVTHVVGG
jgi:isoquinoline 1-oxidoreductase beta subunit